MIKSTNLFGMGLQTKKTTESKKAEQVLHLFEHKPIVSGEKHKVIKLQITDANLKDKSTLNHIFSHAWRIPQGQDLVGLKTKEKRSFLSKLTNGLFGEHVKNLLPKAKQLLVRLPEKSGLSHQSGLYVVNQQSFDLLNQLALKSGLNLGKELSVNS